MASQTNPRAKYEVVGVLAGRYVSLKKCLTHAIEAVGPYAYAPKTLCGRIDAENLVDPMGAEPTGSIPTCKTCAKRLEKLLK